MALVAPTASGGSPIYPTRTPRPTAWPLLLAPVTLAAPPRTTGHCPSTWVFTAPTGPHRHRCCAPCRVPRPYFRSALQGGPGEVAPEPPPGRESPRWVDREHAPHTLQGAPLQPRLQPERNSSRQLARSLGSPTVGGAAGGLREAARRAGCRGTLRPPHSVPPHPRRLVRSH